VVGGLGPVERIGGFADLPAGTQPEVRKHADREGCTRADFESRKKPRHNRAPPEGSEAAVAATALAANSRAEPGEERIPDPEEEFQDGTLHNLEWFGTVSYADALRENVPTFAKVPPENELAIADARATVLKAMEHEVDTRALGRLEKEIGGL